MYICQLQSPSLPLPSLSSGNCKFVFYICDSISVLQINSFVLLFKDSTLKQYHTMLVFLGQISLSMTISRYIHVVANGTILLFFMAEQYSIVYMYHSFFINSFADGHLGCFHVLPIINSAAMNPGVHLFFRVTVFSGYMPWSGIAG